MARTKGTKNSKEPAILRAIRKSLINLHKRRSSHDFAIKGINIEIKEHEVAISALNKRK